MIRITAADVLRPPMFQPIHVPHVKGQIALQTMQGRLGHGDMVQLRLTGPLVRDYFDQILAISCRRINEGQPRRSMGGYADTTVDRGGQLVTLEVREGNWGSGVGIIQVLEATAGPGGPRVTEMTLVFWPVHTIWYYTMGTDDRQSILAAT